MSVLMDSLRPKPRAVADDIGVAGSSSGISAGKLGLQCSTGEVLMVHSVAQEGLAHAQLVIMLRRRRSATRQAWYCDPTISTPMHVRFTYPKGLAQLPQLLQRRRNIRPIMTRSCVFHSF